LTVTPVNDAPTAGDQQLTADEDTPITGSLLAVAADIDSALLQGSLVAGPQHGFKHSAHNGYQSYDDPRSAKLTVQSPPRPRTAK
jgi:hypothetical protein